MGQRMQQLVEQWPGDLIPEYVPKWYGKPRPNWRWLTVMTWVIGVITGGVVLLGISIRNPLVAFGSLGIGGLVLLVLRETWGEKQRNEENEYTYMYKFVGGWMHQLGMGPEYEERRCLHILACLAHLVHHASGFEDAIARKHDLRLAEQLMYFLYGADFERDFGDRLDVSQLRPLVSVAELQRPDSLISEHYRSYEGYRGRGCGIAHIQVAAD